MTGQWTATLLAVIGACFGIGGVATFWAIGESHPIEATWRLPGAEFSVAMDGLSAIFLMPSFPDLAPGKRLRPGLLETDGAPGKWAQAALLLTAR